MEHNLITYSVNNIAIEKSKQNKTYDSFIKNSDFSKINKILSNIEQISYPNTYNKEYNENIIKKAIDKLKNDTFDLSGTLIDLVQVLHPLDQDLFDAELKLKSNDKFYQNFIYSIYFKKIPELFAESLNKLSTNVPMVFLRLKARLVYDEKESKFLLKFFFMKKSKVFCLKSSIIDEGIPLRFNSKIMQDYRAKDIKKLGLSSEVPEKPYKGLGKISPITDPILLQKIKGLEVNDFNSLLTFQTKSLTYPSKHILETIKKLSAYTKKVNIVGVVVSIRTESIYIITELKSLTDSNTIKLLHFANSWDFKPKVKQVLYVQNASIKLNRMIEIVIETPQKGFVKVLGEVSEEEFSDILDFRIGELPYSSFISLCDCVIIRNIHKYLVTFKEIYKLTGIYDAESRNRLRGDFDNFYLYVKCIVDDGSCDAEIVVANEKAIELLHMTKEKVKVKFNF